jgi:dUTP pyrophosphatase
VVTVLVEQLPHATGLAVPAYATLGSAGADLAAAVTEDLVLAPLERAAVPTGLKLAIPEGFEGQVRPRSGLALKQGLTVANAPGTVDSDYRGEVKVILVNLGAAPVTISRGDRIAQLVIAPITRAVFATAAAVPGTDRGAGGFGSTGV